MYRIRRESGEEVTFGSVDEFGAAVAAGVVTAKAEIFHARAEKWLPIASHPHFKLAQDRINGAAAPKPPVRTPGLTASGQRPAVGASGQRPAIGASGQRPAVTAPQQGVPPTAASPTSSAPRAPVPQLRVVRQDAAAAAGPAAPDSAVTQKPAPRWNSAQRPAARAVAPKPSAPTAPATGDLRLMRADPPLSNAATAPELPEVEFELLPAPEEIAAQAAVTPPSVEPVAVEPAPVEAVAPVPVPVAEVPVVARVPEPVAETVVERSHDVVELVSQEERPSAARGEVDIINPDRTMPVVSHREVSALDIPAPIQDFAPVDAPAEPVTRPRSKAPLFVGIAVAAAAAVIGFFALKPSGAAPKPTPVSSVTNAASSQPVTTPVASQPTPTGPGTRAVTSAPKGASTGLGGDMQTKKPKKPADDAQATPATDGLEPPPEVLPAAPRLGKIGDAAALPTIDAGVARNDAMDRMKALEKTRREIDSSMRTGSK